MIKVSHGNIVKIGDEYYKFGSLFQYAQANEIPFGKLIEEKEHSKRYKGIDYAEFWLEECNVNFDDLPYPVINKHETIMFADNLMKLMPSRESFENTKFTLIEL